MIHAVVFLGESHGVHNLFKLFRKKKCVRWIDIQIDRSPEAERDQIGKMLVGKYKSRVYSVHGYFFFFSPNFSAIRIR